MAEHMAHVVDCFSGAYVETLPVSAVTWERKADAESGGTATIPLDGSFTKAELRELLRPWKNILVLEVGGVVQFAGYITAQPTYNRGKQSVSVQASDFWALLDRRVMTGRSATQIQAWSQSVNGTLANIARWHLDESWNRAIVPSPRFPVTVAPSSDTVIETRPYFGYEMKYLGDVFAALMSEGLDVYFRPRWSAPGVFDWLMNAGIGWQTGVSYEFHVTADFSDVAEFSAQEDAIRQTNNAVRVGEGSEVDLLVRSDEDEASDLPLLERITMSKSVSDLDQLQSSATQDLYTYGFPTSQWSFKVPVTHPIDIGDTPSLIFDDDAWMPDGIFQRRVVAISGDLGEFKTVKVQPTGGA